MSSSQRDIAIPGRIALDAADRTQNISDGRDRDGEYASYEFLRKSRQALLRQIELFGIDDGTGKNPTGVKITLDEFIALSRAKDPADYIRNGGSITDDPTDLEIEEIARRRGIVDGADQIKAMENQIVELEKVRTVPGNHQDDRTPIEAEQARLRREIDRIKAGGAPSGGTWTDKMKFLLKLHKDKGLSGEALKTMAADPRWGAAIEYWKKQGVIDAQWNVVQGEVIEFVEDFQADLMESRTLQPMSDADKIKYADEYNAGILRKVDPKLVRIEEMGEGVTRTTVFNADGKTVASIFLSGSLKLPNGQTMDNVTLSGSTLADWKKYQATVDKTGTIFSDTLNGDAEEEAEKRSGGSLTYIDPRSIEGYDPGLAHMGGFPGHVAPILAENKAREAQGLPQIGRPDQQVKPPIKDAGKNRSSLPAGLANLDTDGDGDFDDDDGVGVGVGGNDDVSSGEASWGGGTSSAGASPPAGWTGANLSGGNTFSEGLRRLGSK
ncbi:hypothetical protein [Caudoviricetes sp.]|nr:hypothetical protein [Caudoviricetes sp.]UOF79144.1 hypothetical protein [Caudoviricetes sp.]